MTSYSGMSNFLGVTTYLAIFSRLYARYLDILTSVFVLIHASNMLTCFRGFSSFLQLYLIKARSIKVTDCNKLLTCFAYFLCYIPLYLIYAKNY